MRDDDRDNESEAAPITDPDGGSIPDRFIPDVLKPKDRDGWTPGGRPDSGDDGLFEGGDE